MQHVEQGIEHGTCNFHIVVSFCNKLCLFVLCVMLLLLHQVCNQHMVCAT